jgi:ribonuclease P protein component
MAGDLRLPRSARLLAKAEFDAVFQRGARLGGACFRIHVLHLPGPARLGLALAKRAVPHASDRNRLRRQVREAFRLNRAALHGRHLVVIARNEAATAKREVARADIDRLLDRAAALNPAGATGTMPG